MTQPDPDGEGELAAPVWQYGYDAVGNATTETDPLGNVTTRAYDALNRLVTLTQPDPDGEGELEAPVTEYSYDKAGNLLTVTDPVGNETTWTYDNRNRQLTETNELSQTRSFVYDAAGQLTKRTDRNGRVIEYTFDNLGRQTAELWKDGQTTVRTIAYEYDAAHQLTGVSDPDADYSYDYDSLGNATSITAEIDGLTPTIVFAQAFDAAGNRSSLSATIGDDDDFFNEYFYDNLNRMTRVEQSGQEGGNAVAEKRINFAYDVSGQWASITRYANLAGTQLVAETSYTYDEASRLTALSHTKGANTLAGYTWTYDSSGRVTQFDSEIDGTVDYSYDDTNQLQIS
jgi:YD repeat-containing protein